MVGTWSSRGAQTKKPRPAIGSQSGFRWEVLIYLRLVFDQDVLILVFVLAIIASLQRRIAPTYQQQRNLVPSLAQGALLAFLSIKS